MISRTKSIATSTQGAGFASFAMFVTGLLLGCCVATASADSQSATARLPREALEIVRRLAIQDRGRVKPFDSFARETLEQITGSPTYRGQDPVETVLGIIAAPESWQDAPLLWIPFRPLREPLGMGPKTSHVSYNELLGTRRLMRLLPVIVQKQQRDEKLSMLEQEIMDAYERFVSLSALLE